MTLTEFMLARIAEDERDAKSAHIGAWTYNDSTMRLNVESDSNYWAPSAAETASRCDDPDHWECSEARMNAIIESDHMVRWQPARVLAECEAKRRIVELYELRNEQGVGNLAISAHATGLGLAIRALALPYAAHPDYREEWRL